MKSPSTLLLFVLLFAAAVAPGGGNARAQAADTTSPVEQPVLRRELLEMEKADQAVRQALIQKQKAGEPITPAFVARIDSVDHANRQRLKAILAQHGWPERSLVGSDGAGAAFLIAQHADRDTAFQRRVLKLMRRAYEAGEASGQDVALLTDRVLVAEGRPQRYGTQTSLEDGAVVLHPIADSANVDRRRERMGLPPLEEYIRMVEDMYLPEQEAGSDPDEK